MIFKETLKTILNSNLFKRLGISLINYDLLKYTKHYLWILNIRKIPSLNIAFRDIKDVTPSDILFCERLIAAYHKANCDQARIDNDTSEIWSQSLKKHCSKLISAVESKNAEKLARCLSSLFREDFVYGLASGSLVEHANSRIGAKIWSMKYQDNLLALAEYLGVVRTESPQQGLIAEGLQEGVNALVAKIENVLSISIDFPDIGAPYGVQATNALITMEQPEHIYVALRISKAIQNYVAEKKTSRLNLLEIGAGFGGLAYWMLKLQKEAITYSIIDLSLINVIQGYFLYKAFGPSRISLYAETVSKDSMIFILPTSAIDLIDKQNFDVLINENSMPEMSEPIVERYIRFTRENVSGVFFSYNHESYSVVYGKPQVLVPEIVNRVGGFERLSRDVSWLRSGYVEEIYKRKKGMA